jgi:biopolymer transport protein ExbD
MAKKKNRQGVSVNASSMADIAFLLLIFFLVTTRIASEKGVYRDLAPKPEGEVPPVELNKRNVYKIIINSSNELLIEGEEGKMSQIKKEVKAHVNNYGVDPELSVSPKDAIISIKTDRGTDYTVYLTVLDEILQGYNELRAEYLTKELGEKITVDDFLEISRQDTQVNKDRYKLAKDKYPLNVSDAEPTGSGGAQ